LPIAVDQATALLVDTGWSIPDYLDLLQHSAQGLLDRRDQGDRYPLSVAASWQVAFDHLARTDPAAVYLVTLAAWLAPEPIPLTVFTDHAAMLSEPLASAAGHPLTWAQVLTVLRRRAVARIGPDSLLLHRIPAALLRTHSPVMAPENGWAATAVKALRAAVPASPWNQPATWPVWQTLLPHVLAATDSARAPDTVADDVDWLLDRMATYLQARGETRAARPHYERVYDRRRARHGDDHPDTLQSANSLALELHARGAYAQACSLDQDTLDRYRRILGEDHPDTLQSASNLALDLWALGDYGQARVMDEDTLDRRRRILGEDHPDTLQSANNLAADLRALGEYEQARNLHQETLDRRRHILGDNHPNTLTAANNLAADLRALGEYAQARRHDRDTLNRRSQVLGEDHPDTLVSASNLAADLRALGEHEQARNLDQDVEHRRLQK
jgi:hypothetical protein